MYDSLPHFLRWESATPGADDVGSSLIPLNLSFLYNDFLIHRFLVKRNQGSAEPLINISLDMLSATLELIGEEIASGRSVYNIGRNVCCFFFFFFFLNFADNVI